MILHCVVLLHNNYNTINRGYRLDRIITNTVFWGEGVQKGELKTSQNFNQQVGDSSIYVLTLLIRQVGP